MYSGLSAIEAKPPCGWASRRAGCRPR